MLSTLDDTAERVSTAHRAKLAYIYVRQSTAVQVRHHQESTQLQYRLVDRAAALGWPRRRDCAGGLAAHLWPSARVMAPR